MTDKQIDEALELVRAHMQELYEDAAADIQEGGSAESLRLPQSIDAIVQALERQRDGLTRERFEAFISRPPFEKSVKRFPMDDNISAWPGAYRDVCVDLAWMAWLEASAQRLAAAPDPDN